MKAHTNILCPGGRACTMFPSKLRNEQLATAGNIVENSTLHITSVRKLEM